MIKDHYGQVGEALIYALGEMLGESFTEELKEAWMEVYGIVSGTMQAGASE